MTTPRDLTALLDEIESRADRLNAAIIRDAKAGRLTMSIPASFGRDTDLLDSAVCDDVKLLTGALRECVEALEFIAVPGALHTADDWQMKKAREALERVRKRLNGGAG